MLKIDRKDGDDVKVGEVLGVVEDARGRGPSRGGEPSEPQAASAKTRPESDPKPATEKTRSTPTARKAAEDRDVDLSRVRGSGDAGRVMRRDVEQAAAGGGNGQTRRLRTRRTRCAAGSRPPTQANAEPVAPKPAGDPQAKAEPAAT